MAWQTAWGRSRRTKWVSTKVTDTGGVQWDSKKEFAYSRELVLMEKGGLITAWSAKPVFELKGAGGTVICKHIPDFLVTMPDGSREVHEVKSPVSKTSTWNLKRKLWLDNYPHIKYKVIE